MHSHSQKLIAKLGFGLRERCLLIDFERWSDNSCGAYNKNSGDRDADKDFDKRLTRRTPSAASTKYHPLIITGVSSTSFNSRLKTGGWADGRV